MDPRVTFRHINPDPDLKSYAEQELNKVLKILHRPQEASIIFSKEKNRYIAELSISADGNRFFAREQADNFYLAFDQAFSKIENQIKRYRDKFKPSKKRREREEVVETEVENASEIIRTDELFLPKPVTIEEAIIYLEDSPTGFIVFRNAENERICVIYKREDGNYGLVETN